MYEYKYIGKTKGRQADSDLAAKMGLEKKSGFDQHHENGYLINVPESEHRGSKNSHIGSVGLQNQLLRLIEFKN